MDGNGWKWGDSWDFFGAKKTHLRTFLTDPFRFTSQVREPNLETTNSKNHQPPVPGTWDPCFAPTKKNFQTDSKLYFWCKLDYTHENERGSPLKRDYFSKQYIFHRDMLVFRRVPIWKKKHVDKTTQTAGSFHPLRTRVLKPFINQNLNETLKPLLVYPIPLKSWFQKKRILRKELYNDSGP